MVDSWLMLMLFFLTLLELIVVVYPILHAGTYTLFDFLTVWGYLIVINFHQKWW